MSKTIGLMSAALLLSSSIIFNSWAVSVPSGYRMQHYRAPTPDHVPGGKTLLTSDLQSLLQQAPQACLVDVMAAIYRPETALFDGEWLLSQPRHTLPGSVWLPNVGYGKLDNLFLDYFAHNLANITANNKNHPLVFYCIENCWMAWNATKRAQSLGYTQVYWYKEGVDGWQAAGLPLVETTPIPMTVNAEMDVFE